MPHSSKLENKGILDLVVLMYHLDGIRVIVLGAKGGTATLLNLWELLGGRSSPLNFKSLGIFLKVFCFTQDFQAHFNILLQ